MLKLLFYITTWVVLVSLGPNAAIGQDSDNVIPVAPRLAITNVSVLPMDSERVLLNQTVLIEDGMIIGIGSATKLKPSAGMKVINGTGQFLIPGLADMHTHLRNKDEILSYLAYGVTTIMHLGGSNRMGRNVLELRKNVEYGNTFGPQIFATGTVFRGKQKPEEVRKRVKQLKAEGYDFIKIYNGVTRPEFNAVVDEGAKHNLPVFGHLPRGIDPVVSLSNGQKMVAHTEEFFFTYFKGPRKTANMNREYRPDLRLVPSLISVLKKNGIAVTPALGFTYMNFRQWDGDDNIWDNSEFRYLHPSTIGDWKRSTVLARRPNLENFIFRGQIKYGLLQELTREFQKAGILQLLGTDASVVGLYPGRSAHTELTEFVKAGLSNFEALSIATRNAGKFVKNNINPKAKFGMIKEGYRADMVLVRANPLENIHNARKITGVIAKGKWKTRAQIEERREVVVKEYAKLNRLSKTVADAIKYENARERIRVLYDQYGENSVMLAALESNINSVGYSFVSKKDFKTAIKAFKINTELFPLSANTWDSLGEAHLTIGNVKKAVEFYKKALEVDPTLESAKSALNKIKKEK